MGEITENLQKLFAELVAGDAMEYWWYDGEWALEHLKISSRAKAAPAFFLASATSAPYTEACPDQSVADLRLPFPAFWLSYRIESGDLVSHEFFYFERDGNALKLGTYTRGETRDSWGGRVYACDGTFKIVSDLYPVERKIIGKALEVLTIISQPVEQIPCRPSLLTRRKLSKGGIHPRNTNFINVFPTRYVQQVSVAGGTAKSPHNRQGHWRTYRSGKKVWIRDCAIHGGSDKSRNYAVYKG